MDTRQKASVVRIVREFARLRDEAAASGYRKRRREPRSRCRCSWLGMSCGILLGLPSAGTAFAQEPPASAQISPFLRITGDLLGRVEANDFFRPAPAVNDANDYRFGGSRARLGIALSTPLVEAFVQGEHSGVYGVPDDAVAVPGGPLGTGGAYFAANRDTSASDVHLKQLHLTLKPELLRVPGLSVKLGRFEIRDGLEYRTGDAKFDLLKTERISQRFLHPSDFTYATRSWDGVLAAYDTPAFNLTLSAMRPTECCFNIEAGKTINGIDLAYAAVTGKRGTLLPGTEGRLFYLYYADKRPVRVVDNRPAGRRPFLNVDNLALHTVGFHVLTTQPFGPGVADALAWGAYQFGDWTNLDHEAWAVAAEAGYQWTGLPLRPWIRTGYFRGSGDGDPTDGIHGTFFPALGTVILFAPFPFYNMMNVQDIFGQIIVSPTNATKLRVGFHSLALSESADLFYAGAGAQRRTADFGFAGRPSSGVTSLANVIDVTFTHDVNQHFSWKAFYGHAFGGAVLDRFFRGKSDADYAYLEFTAKF